MSRRLWIAAAFGALTLGAVVHQVPAWAAAALLHPVRRPMTSHPAIAFELLAVERDGLVLRGWRFPARAPFRGTILYLHGIADNRQSSIGVAERFAPRGYDVMAFDSRGHGESGGTVCSYGYHERHDAAAIARLARQGPVVVIGASLGGAVALQAAPEEPRVSAVVAVESFSDLRTVATERAPFFLWRGAIRRAFEIAEARGGFSVDEASPLAVAPRIRVPVLVVHGADDRETPSEHARRIFEALTVPKRLILVPGAGHNASLTPAVWHEIDSWIQNLPHGSVPEPVRGAVSDRRAGDPHQRVIGARDEHEQPPGARRRSRA